MNARPLEGGARWREEALARLSEGPVDLLVVGGGATGLGIAVDGALRGHRVALLERGDLCSATSSRSTKLIHGGVRYLKQGQVALVREGLVERGRLLANAPHLVWPLELVATAASKLDLAALTVGLWAYDALAGKRRLGWSSPLLKRGLLGAAPGVAAERFVGGVRFRDGQFDDARLALALARTAMALGAAVLTRAEVTGLCRDSAGRVVGVEWIDRVQQLSHTQAAKVVINATGAAGDRLRQMERPEVAPLLAPSSGVHIVLPGEFLPGGNGLLVPRTKDGRVMFALPFFGHTLVGTTDVPTDLPTKDPVPTVEEIEFLLETAGTVLARAPRAVDIRSCWSGLRPLVARGAGPSQTLSRDYTIEVSNGGLVTVAGGKWTSYRSMAEAVVRRVERSFSIPPKAPKSTRNLALWGHPGPVRERAPKEPWSSSPYGSEAPLVEAICAERAGGREAVHARLALLEGEVRHAVRHELALTPEDVLERRSRALLYDASAALEAAPKVAALIAEERGLSPEWAAQETQRFAHRAADFLPRAGPP